MGNYHRVLLKLSGEALAGEKKTGLDEATCMEVGRQVKKLTEQGIEAAIVIGGGNFWRGRTSKTIDRTKADQIGMLATVMNSLYVSDIFQYLGMRTKVFTPFSCGSMTELFSKHAALDSLKEGSVVFLAGGTGHPYFSTDTATALRAVELECDVILMARAVDGVYDSDPKKNPQAKKLDKISIQEVIERRLGIMDLTSSVICMENELPLLIFSLSEEDGILKAATGNSTGTIVTAQNCVGAI